jgi:pyruvate/2-oxoacid:ferredoxin oxidoreductase beta subunit
MTFHDGVSYVATATLSHLEDLTQKLMKAKRMVKEGMVYIHLLSPCPTGWGTPTNSAFQLGKLAVETNYFPLWEAEQRKIHFTYRVKHPRPVMEFFKATNRFRHLDSEDFTSLQDWVDKRMKLMESLADLDTQVSRQKVDEIVE